MKIRTFLSVPALLLAVAACSSTAPLPQGQVVGAEMQPQTPVRFAVVDASPAQYFDKPVLVEATVKAVCQKMGCWMQVEDEGHTAMVRWESGCGGKYSFPKDAAGKRVLIQGTFYPKHMDESEVEHLKEEGGAKLAVRQDGYEFNASSVMYLDAPATSGSSASSR
jgi:hypothetical protein